MRTRWFEPKQDVAHPLQHHAGHGGEDDGETAKDWSEGELGSGTLFGRSSHADAVVIAHTSGGSASILRTSIALVTRASTSTAAVVLLGRLGNGGKVLVGDNPRRRRGRGALRGGAAALVSTIASRYWGLGVGILEGAEIGTLGDRVAVNVDEAIVGFFLGVFVDETTRVDSRHVGTVDRGNFAKVTRVGVAAEFREAVYVLDGVVFMIRHLQDGDAIVCVLLNLLVPSRGLESGRIAPGVVVEGEEVASDLIWATVHVFSHLEAVDFDIGSGVSDRN